jgi:uncharacterized protein YceK
MSKNSHSQIIIKIIISLCFLLLFIGCVSVSSATLSRKAQSQNIKAVSSKDMVNNMTSIHTYLILKEKNNYSDIEILNLVIHEANKAADEGYSDIIVLIENFIASDNFFAISYWK